MEDSRCCCWEYDQWRFLLANLDSLAGQGSSGNTSLAEQGLRGNATGAAVNWFAGMYEYLIVPSLESKKVEFPEYMPTCLAAKHDNSSSEDSDMALTEDNDSLDKNSEVQAGFQFYG